MATESSWVEHFYTHFLGRDISYLFSGGLFICIAEYALWGEIVLPTGLSLEVIGFLMVSYFLGISSSNLDILGTGKLILPPEYSHYLIFNQDLMKYYDESVLNLYERLNFMMMVGKNVGFSSFFGGILMLILNLIPSCLRNRNTNIEYYLLAIFLLIYGFFMINGSKSWVRQINSARQELAKDITDKKNN